MEALIARLEAADEGSVELDARIWCTLNGKRFREAWDGRHGAGLGCAYTEPPKRTRIVPRSGSVKPCSRSLDAKLPGENIVSMARIKFRSCKYYVAQHKEPNGVSFKGEGKTEVLARRLARLKAIQAQTAPVSPEDARQRLPEDMTHDLEPTKLQEAVARVLCRKKGVDPDMGTAMVGPEFHIMERAWECEVDIAEAAIRATLDLIDAMGFDNMRKYAQEATWRAPNDVEKDARVLHATDLWREMSRHIRARESGG